MSIKVVVPIVLIALDACASCMFAWYRDYSSCGFWACMAGLGAFALFKQIGW